jgi:DNA-binding response OmpR family regulator
MPTILVVEDDVDVADMLDAYFRVQGYEVLTANWGEQAVEFSRSQHPDLVILDIRLPDIDGYEVASRLRSNRRTKDIPILFLTEKRDRLNRLQGLELGADDYMTKPFDIQELRLRVRNALRRTSESTITNPITGLAEGALVDERLQECLQGKDWAILDITIENFDKFREKYGFVTADDMLRAVSLMIKNAVRSQGGVNDFLGHPSQTEFLIVTSPDTAPSLIERIHQRLEQSWDFFYPLKDRGHGKLNAQRLKVYISQLRADEGSFSDLKGLKRALRGQRINFYQ